MSRGLGVLQRAVLDALGTRVLQIMEIAYITHGPNISRAQYEALRRALRALEDRGLINQLLWKETMIGGRKPYALAETYRSIVEDAMQRLFTEDPSALFEFTALLAKEQKALTVAQSANATDMPG